MGEPINLGYPINTHKDENSILISADGSLAMFASDREEGLVVWIFTVLIFTKQPAQFVTYLKGTVYDETNGQKLEARFDLTDLKTGEVAVRSFSNKGNGEFLVCLPTNRDYALNVSRRGICFILRILI
ncbi:MAG: hypothetical protein R2759_19895 [Bacteroidales bacterium]